MVDHVVGDGVVLVLEVDQLDSLLGAVGPGPHELAQERGRERHVAPRLLEHAVELAVVGRAPDQLRQGAPAAAHAGHAST